MYNTSAFFKLVIFSSIFVVLSCTSSKKAAQENPKPQWVLQKPIEQGYYIGVGNTPKIGTPIEYGNKARERALNDMASSISSTISSTSVLNTMEDRYGNTEAFSQTIKVSTNEYLEGFEPVASYETESDYWVLYKISKATYLSKKAEKKRKAVNNALSKYNLANQQQSEDALKALKTYIQAIVALKNYLGEACMAQLNGSEQELGSFLFSRIDELRQDIRIISVENEVKVKRHKIATFPIYFKVNYQEKPLCGAPIKLHYSGGYLSKNQLITNQEGQISVTIPKSVSGTTTNNLLAQLDWKTIVSNATSDMSIRRLLKPITIPESKVNVIIEPSTLFVKVENVKNMPEFKEKVVLAAKNFNMKIQDTQSTDFQLFVKVKYEDGTSAGGLTSVYVTVETYVLNSNSKRLGKKNSPKIRGVGTTRQEAIKEALEQIVQHVTNNHVPELMQFI